MSNLLSQVNLKNKVSRNGFDLSFRNAFTAKVGELLPICVKDCLPGDKFKINTSWFTRTQPVQSAAYSRFREYVDVFLFPIVFFGVRLMILSYRPVKCLLLLLLFQVFILL